MMNRNDSKEFDNTLSKNNVLAQHPPWKITPSTKLDSNLHDGFDKTFNPPTPPPGWVVETMYKLCL